MAQEPAPAAAPMSPPRLLWDGRHSRSILWRAAGTMGGFALNLGAVVVATWGGSPMGSIWPERRALEAMLPGDAVQQRTAAESIRLAATARTVIAVAMALLAALAVILFRAPVLRPKLRSPTNSGAEAPAVGDGGAGPRRADELRDDEEAALSPAATAGARDDTSPKPRVTGPSSRVEPTSGTPHTSRFARANGSQSPNSEERRTGALTAAPGPTYDTATAQGDLQDGVREEPAGSGSSSLAGTRLLDDVCLSPQQLYRAAYSTLALIAGTTVVLAALCFATDLVAFLGHNPIVVDGSRRLFLVTGHTRSGAIDAIMISVAAELSTVRPFAGVSQWWALCLWAFDLGYILLLAVAVRALTVALGLLIVVTRLVITLIAGWSPARRVWRGEHLERASAHKTEEDTVNTATAAGLRRWIWLHEQRYYARASHTVDFTAAGACFALAVLQIGEVLSFVEFGRPSTTVRLQMHTARTAGVVAVKALVLCLGIGIGLLYAHQYVR